MLTSLKAEASRNRATETEANATEKHKLIVTICIIAITLAVIVGSLLLVRKLTTTDYLIDLEELHETRLDLVPVYNELPGWGETP